MSNSSGTTACQHTKVICQLLHKPKTILHNILYVYIVSMSKCHVQVGQLLAPTNRTTGYLNADLFSVELWCANTAGTILDTYFFPNGSQERTSPNIYSPYLHRKWL